MAVHEFGASLLNGIIAVIDSLLRLCALSSRRSRRPVLVPAAGISRGGVSVKAPALRDQFIFGLKLAQRNLSRLVEIREQRHLLLQGTDLSSLGRGVVLLPLNFIQQHRRKFVVANSVDPARLVADHQPGYTFATSSAINPYC